MIWYHVPMIHSEMEPHLNRNTSEQKLFRPKIVLLSQPHASDVGVTCAVTRHFLCEAPILQLYGHLANEDASFVVTQQTFRVSG